MTAASRARAGDGDRAHDKRDNSVEAGEAHNSEAQPRPVPWLLRRRGGGGALSLLFSIKY